jgi:hypothetical protein
MKYEIVDFSSGLKYNAHTMLGGGSRGLNFVWIYVTNAGSCKLDS